METALAQIATWCDTSSNTDKAYFAYKLREYLLCRSRIPDQSTEDCAEAMMAEMLEFLADEEE